LSYAIIPDIAEVFFENISGQAEVEDVQSDDDDEEEATSSRRKRKKMRVTYGANKTTFPELFQNDSGQIWTIRIDSKRLEKIESEDPDATRDEAAKELREIVNTVGKPGKPGQDVRCVVSVAMLTEGWDASNVTHILGVRAFGSQLLCEQVVGRGLRRMNYTPDTQTELLPEEYVDVYGIPFSVIPYKGKPSRTPPDRPVNRVYAVQEWAAYELRFPNVRVRVCFAETVHNRRFREAGAAGHRAGKNTHGNFLKNHHRPPRRRRARRRHRRI
jgi:type III restriction enzyme